MGCLIIWLFRKTLNEKTIFFNFFYYAIMEKTDKAVVVPMDAQWNDVGSWSALWDLAEKDNDNNHIFP